MKKKKYGRATMRGETVGKNPFKNVSVDLTSSKYTATSAKKRKKQGGVVRKPSATISYRRKSK